jgi:hexosaminidase
MTPIDPSDIASGIRRSFFRNHPACIAIAICAMVCARENCVASARGSGLAVSVTWKLVDNAPDGHFKSELDLRNDGAAPLPESWSLYFNSASKLKSDANVSDFELSHVNGDFYFLRPKDGLKPIGSGEHRRISLEGSPWAINVSDAPSGFYIVTGKEGAATEPVIVPLQIEPFPPADKLHRGAADAIPVLTTKLRFLENEALTKLPPEQLVKVVPTPSSIDHLPRSVLLKAPLTVFCEPSLLNEAQFLAGAFGELMNRRVAVEEGILKSAAADSVRLRIGKVTVAGRLKRKGDEAYALTVRPQDGIEITGSDAAGVFYGIQTLRALLPVESYREKNSELRIEAVRIADSPRFRYRGLHLDVARNFQPKDTVEKLLDLMAFYKLNHLHLHLTDDEGWRIEINELPELTEVGGRRGHTLDEAESLIPSHGSGPFANAKVSAGSGYYSQDDFVEILRYADMRHIQVVPEVDLPGHARAAIKSMEARQSRFLRQGREDAGDATLLREPGDESKYESVQMWHDNVVDVGRDATYRFLDIVVGELSEMYQRAGVVLTSVHLGGDEVPSGAWEESAACRKIKLDVNLKIPRRGQLEMYFLNRASEIIRRRSIQPACWEDCLLLEVTQDGFAGDRRREAGKPTPTAYVWNNVWGWGREDAAYRLANAGFDVVLCNATHLYLDLACEKDPLDRGYYWAGFVGMRAPFEFIPLDIFKNANTTSMGDVVREKTLSDRIRLTESGANHILGIQGQLWGENLRSGRSVEYMGFPRIVALAERAWARSPDWAHISDSAVRNLELQRDWNQFANRLGQRELPRLDYIAGGVQYRLPPPGAAVREGRLRANVTFPGLSIRYTTDGTEPDVSSHLFQEDIPLLPNIKLRSFDTRGRGSRTVNVNIGEINAD